MDYLYTWKDVEYKLLIKKDIWGNIISADVYNDEVVIYVEEINNLEKVLITLKDIFGSRFNAEKKVISLDIMQKELPVYFEKCQDYQIRKKETLPLFKSTYFDNSIYTNKLLDNLKGAPVFAFHSYKGGVGRTLSLISIARELSNREVNGNDFKVLIIDSDIEAPGLTWLSQDKNIGSEISYLDILSILHSDGMSDTLVEEVSKIVEKSVIRIEGNQKISEHFLIPTYRCENQVMDIYAHPVKIVETKGKEYIIGNFLSELGEKLGVNAVLVDLRAGISEFSSPILFDQRIKKIFVSSTSLQSVRGTCIILEQVCKGLNATDSILPTVLITMIPEKLDATIKSNVESEFYNTFEKSLIKNTQLNDENQDAIFGDLVVEIPFQSELIHLEGFDQICNKIKGTSLSKVAIELVNNLFMNEIQQEKVGLINREKTIELLHNLSYDEITAEGSNSAKVLATLALQNLVRKYRYDIPITVIMGAKGTGKTFLYKRLLSSKMWESFMKIIDPSSQPGDEKVYVAPIIASINRNHFIDLLNESYDNINRNIENITISKNICSENEKVIIQKKKQDSDELEWEDFWVELILKSIGGNFNTLHELDSYLNIKNKKIMFIIDGLEEIFNDTSNNFSSQHAITSLCQRVINILNSLEYKNLGMIIFLRKDLATDSIGVNFTQFNQQYASVELKWSRTEALRLALWLVNQVDPNFYTSDVPIEKASNDIIEQYLNKLWGIKLGRPNSNEAYSSRWILAALSDFNGQLQARDIIRFLKYATENFGVQTYDDRIIMPTEIKKALPQCSYDKISEIKLEIAVLKPILDKLENAESSFKVLPLDPSSFNLNSKEELILKQQGYLKIDNDKYYLPEIIRHALGFKYEKGARPKVLSLLLKQ